MRIPLRNMWASLTGDAECRRHSVSRCPPHGTPSPSMHSGERNAPGTSSTPRWSMHGRPAAATLTPLGWPWLPSTGTWTASLGSWPDSPRCPSFLTMSRKRPSLRKDENETAFSIVQAMIGEGPRPAPPGEREKNPEAVKRGRKGGKKGGKARAQNMTAQERQKSAQTAANSRWRDKGEK